MSDRHVQKSRPGDNPRRDFAFIGTNFPRLAGKPVDYEAVKYAAFHDHDLVVIPLKHPMLSWVDVEEAKRIGAKLYGSKA